MLTGQSVIPKLEADGTLHLPTLNEGMEMNGSRDRRVHPYPSAHGKARVTVCEEVPGSTHV